ncbi:hypothetical protein OBV_12490 [Oscillibacter valericigenes Sjm18-20]|nr:hypothetical protein OBV_12490 [Oscillibacter valericigenes Sjm18-20]
MEMNILIVDAQGGGIGRQLITAIKASGIHATVTAVGTNEIATGAMIKAGADQCATGENAVVVCSRKADVIMGPIGIVIADAMLGEITPTMAISIAQSNAVRVLIPISHCDNVVVGIASNVSISQHIQSAVNILRELAFEK